MFLMGVQRVFADTRSATPSRLAQGRPDERFFVLIQGVSHTMWTLER
jgi:hypothetical protein